MKSVFGCDKTSGYDTVNWGLKKSQGGFLKWKVTFRKNSAFIF